MGVDLYILYDVADNIATITLNRPEAANAQNGALLEELNDAWIKAAEDPDVKVIILRGEGKHFSAGHDLKPDPSTPAPAKITLENIYQIEARRYLEFSLRWRNVPKPSIAAVQGRCIAGALLLCWPCDLFVAADDAKFSDPVVAMGIGGVEYHGHTWELGPRTAKEILFTGRAITAEEAEKVGMVNKVVPRARPGLTWTPRPGRWPRTSPRCRRSGCARPSAPATRRWTSRASTRPSSRSSTSTRPATATPCPSPASRC